MQSEDRVLKAQQRLPPSAQPPSCRVQMKVRWRIDTHQGYTSEVVHRAGASDFTGKRHTGALSHLNGWFEDVQASSAALLNYVSHRKE